ncbi:sensor histidine kinase [Paraliomyxa miuraensis]|uniref:sensor histidine kinase n=1 Tax=Paraliomyxa miuraensis TaxID=376150 RepID=UPI0022518020|nr:ATP-binding protein [Paraliomyxa miuraensis]MCX4246872.1 ATP-binding protein [Paraliomyxa miuraensis]
MDVVEHHYEEIFQLTPVSLWEEDWAVVYAELDRLRDEGVTDFRAHFAGNPAQVFELASRVQITDMNEYTLELFEAESREQILGALATVFDAESFPVFAAQMVAAAEGKQQVSSEAYARTVKGKRIHVLMTLRMLERREGRVPVLLSMLDITERKAMEDKIREVVAALERSNKELEQFAYVASHDLQEPLRMVASYTQLLAQRYREQLDERAHKYIDYAVDGAKRMQDLINDLLHLSRVGTEGKPLVPVALEAVLDQVLVDLHGRVVDTGGEVSRGPLPTVDADAVQMSQLFLNLIGNGLKFRREGVAPAVHVSARPEGNEWVISVRDNGIGIEQQHHDDVFVLFRRLHGRGEYSGTGIGLAITKKIVERHGGRIWVESTVGEGSNFHIALPRSRSTP